MRPWFSTTTTLTLFTRLGFWQPLRDHYMTTSRPPHNNFATTPTTSRPLHDHFKTTIHSPCRHFKNTTTPTTSQPLCNFYSHFSTTDKSQQQQQPQRRRHRHDAVQSILLLSASMADRKRRRPCAALLSPMPLDCLQRLVLGGDVEAHEGTYSEGGDGEGEAGPA